MPFKKGEVANPLGGTAKQNALARRMMGLTFKAVDAIERVLDDPDATHGERLTAAKEVLDRALGKARQQTNVSVEHNASPHLTALVSLAAATALRVQGAPENTSQLIDITGDVTNDDLSLPAPLNANAATTERDHDNG